MVPNFSGASYIELDLVMDMRSETFLQITFNPSSPNGHIFFAGNALDLSTFDFLALSLVDCRVVLEFDLGPFPHATLSSDAVELNAWHTVLVHRERQMATMTVNRDQFGPVSVIGNFTQLTVQSTISLGGPRNFTMLLPRIGSRDMNYFQGCISSFIVRKFAQ